MNQVIKGWLVGSAMVLCLAQAGAENPDVKIGIEHAGVYRVSFEDLGFVESVKSRKLQLTGEGQPIPIMVDDGGDRSFDPGDTITFNARHLRGDQSHFNEFSRHNVYRLTTVRRGARFEELRESEADAVPARVVQHLEQDKVRVRFRTGQEVPEVWYWERLSQIDRKPFKQSIDLGSAPGKVRLEIDMRGWSRPMRTTTAELTDHSVTVLLDGVEIGVLEFEAQEGGQLDLTLPAELATPGKHELSITVPKRRPEGLEQDIVDVVLLNYVRIEHDYAPGDALQEAFFTRDRGAVIAVPEQTMIVGDAHIVRVAEPREVALPPGQNFSLVRGQNFQVPAWIEPDEPSNLASRRNRADYVMIAHPSLKEAIEPLAAHHRKAGLDVMVVDVRDVYDEFNHGIVAPDAIRDFLARAYHEWRHPPRLVLLVGDASWDVHNDEKNDRFYADWTFQNRENRRFLKNASDSYAETGDRNLIPAYSVETYEGHAASDNVFVAVDGDDFKPDMAIGRLPVVKPEEVTAIVNKLIAYDSLAEIGPWRRNILWITNEQTGFQRISDQLANAAATDGFGSVKVYPKPEEEDNSAHQEFLTEAFNDGQLLVHFLGHGGRYIWRTGPPDFKKNHDLFTLESLEALEPNARLPMILSMTCYSAPFDHPTADSIGEKFLRLPDRGAMAVFAASWRNSPGRRFSGHLVEALTEPGKTIGEAILEAKQAENSRIMVETYNLLGDPASKLALPGEHLILAGSSNGREIRVSAELATETAAGRYIVDWLDADGNVLQSEEKAAPSGLIEASWTVASVEGENPAAARVYFWDTDEGFDAFGTLAFDPAPASGP